MEVRAKAGDLASALGVKSKVAKAAMRLLKKHFLTGEGSLRSDVVEWLAEQDIRVRGRRMAWRTGSCYTLIKVKRSRVSAYTVPANLVNEVEEELERRGAAGVRELARDLGSSPILISRALQVLELLGKASRSDGEYHHT